MRVNPIINANLRTGNVLEARHLYRTLQTMLVPETSARFLVSWMAITCRMQICKICNSPTAGPGCRRDVYFGLRIFSRNIAIEGERLAEAEPNSHFFTGLDHQVRLDKEVAKTPIGCFSDLEAEA